MSYHLFGCVQIGNNSITKRSYSNNIFRRFPQHFLCFRTYGNYFFGTSLNSYNRRLTADNSFPFDIYQSIASPEIDPYIS